jgi:hypothetical protein
LVVRVRQTVEPFGVGLAAYAGAIVEISPGIDIEILSPAYAARAIGLPAGNPVQAVIREDLRPVGITIVDDLKSLLSG